MTKVWVISSFIANRASLQGPALKNYYHKYVFIEFSYNRHSWKVDRDYRLIHSRKIELLHQYRVQRDSLRYVNDA